MNYLQSNAAGGLSTTTSGQILNLYITDRIFYSNDMTLGAYIFRSKASLRSHVDFRVRYTLNMSGYRYIFYSSYTPYKIYGNIEGPLSFRVFQAALNLQPRFLPAISSSYSSTRQFSSDHPRKTNSFSNTWNIGTMTSQIFGNFRANYQRQTSRADVNKTARDLLQIVNLSYDISKQWPAKISWATSYSYTGSRNDQVTNLRNTNNTHNAAVQAGRVFGKWLVLSAATSGRQADFSRDSQKSTIQDFFASASSVVNVKENISVVFLRGYSISKTKNDTTTSLSNDYINLSGNYRFLMKGDKQGNISLSRTVYLQSALGRSTVDNGNLVFDLGVYRETNATLNFGISRNSRVALGSGRFQISRSLTLTSQPTPKMSVNFNYQSSYVADKISLIKGNNDNMTLSLTHAPKTYFNYTFTYDLTIMRVNVRNTISSISVALNFQLSSRMSFLTTYTHRDNGHTGATLGRQIDQSATARLSWNIGRRSTITVNYAISNFNTDRQSDEIGGYYSLSF